MPDHPLPWPYSDWDQRPARRAPWQRGYDLYEAYGRFLERIENGTLCEDDGGWCDYGRTAVNNHMGRRTAFVDTSGHSHDSGSYDSHFGYTTEKECEDHRLKENAKLKRADRVDENARQAFKRIRAGQAAAAAWCADVFSCLRKRGPLTTAQVVDMVGPNPSSPKANGTLAFLNRKFREGILDRNASRNGRTFFYRWSIRQEPD